MNGYGDPWNYWWSSYNQVGSSGSGGGSAYNELLDPLPDSDYDTYDDDASNYTPGNTDTTSITFNALTDTWRNIPNVLSLSQFVGYRHGVNCLKLAQEQIAKKSLTDLGSADVFQAYKASSGIDPTAARNGVNYIMSKLNKGDPVMVGVDNLAGSPPGNPDLTTDHFVVIVGAGVDTNGNYFQFFDSASSNTDGGANPYNRLYYNPTTGKITGASHTGYGNQAGRYPYVVTHVRKNK